MTWRQLIRLQPELAKLEADALAAHADGRSDWRSWNEIRRRLSELVGWWCTSAWDAAYDRLRCVFERGKPPRRQSGAWPPRHARLPSPGTLEGMSNQATPPISGGSFRAFPPPNRAGTYREN